MFRGTGSLGSLSILRIAGAHGAEPHAGFWVLLGGPKVPPRRVLKTGNERKISTRIASMVRKTHSPTPIFLRKKVPLTVPKKLCGRPPLPPLFLALPHHLCYTIFIYPPFSFAQEVPT